MSIYESIIYILGVHIENRQMFVKRCIVLTMHPLMAIYLPYGISYGGIPAANGMMPLWQGMLRVGYPTANVMGRMPTANDALPSERDIIWIGYPPII